MKPDSLYNCGMKPLIYSDAHARYKSKLIGFRGKIRFYNDNVEFEKIKPAFLYSIRDRMAS